MMQLALFQPAPEPPPPPVAIDAFHARMQYRRKGHSGTWLASTAEARGQGSREALERCRANAGRLASEWEATAFTVIGPSPSTGETIPTWTWNIETNTHNPRPEWLRPEER